MMEALTRRVAEIAEQAQQQQLRRLAAKLRQRLGSAATIEVEDRRVVVRARGVLKQWLIDPGLRFLAGPSS